MGLFNNRRKQTGEKCNYKFKLESTSKRKKVGFTWNNTGINVVVNTAQGQHFSMPLIKSEGETVSLAGPQCLFMDLLQQEIQN